MPFDEKVRKKVLLWCDRHCCLCRKPCGINIEVHHLIPEDQGGKSEIDNAIPLCFECHGIVQHYNVRHPIGTKYKPDELKHRRDQIYEEYTRHLVPPIHYEITQSLPGGQTRREFPNVGFIVTHMGNSLPVRVRAKVEAVDSNGQEHKFTGDHYYGEKLWHLNPRFMISGHFNISDDILQKVNPLKLRVSVSIIDQYEREHHHLPIHYIYVSDGNYWYLEP
jgi:hypothetical protein